MRGRLKAVIILGILFSASYISGGRIPYLIFYIISALLIIDFIWSVTGKGVRVHSWIEPTASSAGNSVKVYTEIKNNSPWPVPWIQIWTEMPGTFCLPDNLCCYTFYLGPFARKVVFEELECKMRGKFSWGKTVIKGGGFLGIFEYTLILDDSRVFEVLPKFYYLGRISIRGGKGKTELQPLHYQGRESIEGFGIRNYDPADGMSRIHWKISARTQHLVSREYLKADCSQTVLFLDNGRERHSENGPDGSFEKAVSLVASVAAALVAAGHGTGLIVCGSQIYSETNGPSCSKLIYGRSNFIQIIKQLTGVTMCKDCTIGEAIRKFLFSSAVKAHLILVTGALDNDTVEMLLHKKARGHSSTVFLLKLESFGTPLDSTNRERLMLRLKNYGIQVIPVAKDTDLRLMLGRPGYGVG